MKIKGLIWFDDIIEKIKRKHDVHQLEVREVLDNDPHFRFVENGHRSGEKMSMRQWGKLKAAVI